MKTLTSALLAALSLSLLSACATESDYQRINKEIMNNQYHNPEKDCDKYGLSPASPEYQQCVSSARSCTAQESAIGICIL